MSYCRQLVPACGPWCAPPEFAAMARCFPPGALPLYAGLALGRARAQLLDEKAPLGAREIRHLLALLDESPLLFLEAPELRERAEPLFDGRYLWRPESDETCGEGPAGCCQRAAWSAIWQLAHSEQRWGTTMAEFLRLLGAISFPGPEGETAARLARARLMQIPGRCPVRAGAG